MRSESSSNPLFGIKLAPRGPFTSDPQGLEAWCWMALPVILLAVIVATALYSPDWYLRWAQPEGYGLLEVSHFFIPAVTALIAVSLLRHAGVRREPLLVAWTVMLALGSIYIAGEEHSWGQHFFKWNTPEYWRSINRQQETNLHNISHAFGKLPRSILFAGIVAIGFVYPLLTLRWPGLNARNPLAIFMPPVVLLPAALCLIVVDAADKLDAMILVDRAAVRLSEISETFIYLFLLLGVISLRRRILEIGRTPAS